MQKMMKLSDTHYILVDDSEVKVGDIVVEKLLTGGYELFEIHTLNDIDKVRQKKVTHSNQPLENINFVDEAEGIIIPKIKPLSLSEVEEAINGYSVEKMAERLYSRVISENEYDFKRGFEIGFNAHKELVKDKYTKEDMWAMFIAGKQLGLAVSASIRNGSDKPNQEQYFNECIESRNPSTEWECSIDEQGKLKLI